MLPVRMPHRERFGGVAQLGERTVRIRKVESSILFVSTITHTHEPAPLIIAVWRNVFAISIPTK